VGELDDLAAAAAAVNRTKGLPQTRDDAPWLIHRNGLQVGPFAESELRRLISTGSIGPETKAWRDGMSGWAPIGQVLGPSLLADSSVRRKPSGIIARYRHSVGRRSFIFQLWLLAWTIFYVVWFTSVWGSALSHLRTPPAGAVPAPVPVNNAPPSAFSVLDFLAGATSGWVCVCSGWAIIGLPIGIAAVATLENAPR
jgi:hypothetical protein